MTRIISTPEKTDEYLERILNSAGSSLRHYTPQSKENLRSEMRKIVIEIGFETIGLYRDEKGREVGK